MKTKQEQKQQAEQKGFCFGCGTVHEDPVTAEEVIEAAPKGATMIPTPSGMIIVMSREGGFLMTTPLGLALLGIDLDDDEFEPKGN